MSRKSVEIPDGLGTNLENIVFPDGPCAICFDIAAGAANLEVMCDDPELTRQGQGDGAKWAVVAAAVITTPQFFVPGAKVTGVRLLPIGGAGSLQVSWSTQP